MMDDKLLKYLEDLEQKLQHTQANLQNTETRLRELEVFIKGYNNNNGLIDRFNAMEHNITTLTMSLSKFEKEISDKLSMFSGVMKGIGGILAIVEFLRFIYPLVISK